MLLNSLLESQRTSCFALSAVQHSYCVIPPPAIAENVPAAKADDGPGRGFAIVAKTAAVVPIPLCCDPLEAHARAAGLRALPTVIRIHKIWLHVSHVALYVENQSPAQNQQLYSELSLHMEAEIDSEDLDKSNWIFSGGFGRVRERRPSLRKSRRYGASDGPFATVSSISRASERCHVADKPI